MPQVIFALFLGPWSDRAGRKFLILVPFVGYILVCLAFIANVYFFEELPVEFLWVENISAIFGSQIIFYIGCYGHLADTTSIESRSNNCAKASLLFRTIRMAIFDGCLFGMDIIGNFMNAPIFNRSISKLVPLQSQIWLLWKLHQRLTLLFHWLSCRSLLFQGE